MDKIILGILMLRRMTAYELRNTIRDNSSLCAAIVLEAFRSL